MIYRHNTNSRKIPDYNLSLRKTIKKIHRINKIKKYASCFFGMVGVLMLIGSIGHIEFEVTSYSGFVRQMLFGVASILIALFIQRK